MALVLVLGALTILAVMLVQVQDESSAEFGSALATRDALKAEYAAKSAINLSRLLIASEPTIRQALTPLFLLLGRKKAPQLPVWEFADQVLGAFNDGARLEAFSTLANVKTEDGKNLGIEGAGFDVTILDEDSKLNLNVAARGDAFSQIRLATQLMGLIGPPQYDPLFEGRDADGQFTSRQEVCAAIVDWSDPDQDKFLCDMTSSNAGQAPAEDSFYQQLKKPYLRKNAAYDSLDELHLVRGVGDDFWATFIEPDPDSPGERVATVWGAGKVNVNTANPQTILALVLGQVVPESPFLADALAQQTFLTLLSLVRTLTAGAPLFSSAEAFVQFLQGKGDLGLLLQAVQLEPIVLKSPSEFAKAVTTESKVFSIYATGRVGAGKRETTVRVHAVVDFAGAPKPSTLAPTPQQLAQLGMSGPEARAAAEALLKGLPEGASEDAIAAVFRPDPAGTILYYRMD